MSFELVQLCRQVSQDRLPQLTRLLDSPVASGQPDLLGGTLGGGVDLCRLGAGPVRYRPRSASAIPRSPAPGCAPRTGFDPVRIAATVEPRSVRDHVDRARHLM